MTTARTGCVWCPDWPVTAARRRDPTLGDDRPVVVHERVGARDVVRAACARARADGVVRGMRRREAEARCPDAAFVGADVAFEARAFEVVARALEAVTPRVVLDRPGLCAFSTRGPSRYFGGDDALAVRVLTLVRDALAGGEARVGVADGVFTARVAARRADPVLVVPPGGSAAFLAPWPVSVLDDDVAELLVRLGLRTLGDVAALPRDAVLARFGAGGAQLHDLARGVDPGPPVLVAPPPDLVEQVELDPPTARVDVAAFAAKRLADRLVTRLAARGLACTRVVVEAETEHGERLARCWRHDGALTPGALAERVRWQLDGWLSTPEGDAETDVPTAALSLVRLVPSEVVPADARQLGFWGGDQAARDRADRALTRVQGMLGADHVVTAVVQGGRTPAEQVRFVRWGEPREPERPLAVAGEVPGWPGRVPGPFPARVFVGGVPAEVLDEAGRAVTVSGRGEQSARPAFVRCAALPGGGGRVWSVAGPWTYDLRWWDRAARRRRALWQVVVGTPAGDVACLAAVEGGRAVVEALHD